MVAAPGGGLRARLDGVWHDVRLEPVGTTARYLLDLDGRRIELLAAATPQGVGLQIEGAAYQVERVAPGRARRDAGSGGGDELVAGRWQLRSPLTGAIVEIGVALGDVVAVGDVLVIVEAMKMQNELRARVGGEVTAIRLSVGERVEPGSLLLEVTPPAA